MKLLRTTLLVLVCTVPVVALAQWQWIDKDGRKVFSDQAPPADVPAKNILRRPGARGAAAPADAAEPTAAAAPAAPAASAPRLSGKEKELEEKRKQAQAAEADKKKAQEEEIARIRADNCVRAQRSKAAFDSGVRIARINEKGEREFLEDAARAEEARRNDAVIARECKPAGG